MRMWASVVLAVLVITTCVNMGKTTQGTQCCAYGCNKRRKIHKTEKQIDHRSDSEGASDDESCSKRKYPRTFHKFPKNDDNRKKWETNMHRYDWSPSKYSVICSDHFLEKHINRTQTITRLKENAVPTRFKFFPKHLKKKNNERRQLKRKPPENYSEPINILPTTEDPSTSTGPSTCTGHADNPKLSPRKVNKILENRKKRIVLLEKKLKTAKQKIRRYRNRVDSLTKVVQLLKKEQLISVSCEEMLNKTISGVPLDMFKRMTSGKLSGKGVIYSDELMAFAMTLHFYSAKAYEFVREIFKLSLPHQSTIRSKYSKVHAEPGFTELAFVELKKKAEEAKENGKKVICSLMLDEMAIKKHVFWDGIRFRGYVDLGNDVEDDDSLPVARDALVFMVVCVNSSWKVPCAYFFLDGLGGSERANLIKICIHRLYDAGIKVISVTCDGPSCHFSMMSHLGVSLKFPILNTSFPHPNENEHDKVYALLDVCHMLKLVRNCLANYGTLLDSENKQIHWKYFVHLQNLQEEQGLRLANKLKKPHIHWWQQKMKVNLAAQVFSNSVADSLEFCSKELKLKQFDGCEATVKFIRYFDQLFDILNSRNPMAKGYKAALRVTNKQIWNDFLDDAYNYISELKNLDEVKMCLTKRKTGFIGFLVAIKSFQGIFHDLVEVDKELKCVLTYKFSQDHLELFFGAVRAAGGSNNNPTAVQFTAIYKRLLIRSSIQGGKGNVEKRDQTNILYMIGDTCKVNGKELITSDAALIKRYGLSETSVLADTDYTDAPQMTTLSEYKAASISYIAGYVAKMTEKQTLCIVCLESIGSRKHSHESIFLKFKDRGGLFKPSKSVVKVCEETEKKIVRMLNKTNGRLPLRKGIPDAIASSVLEIVANSNVFSELNDHMLETALTEKNHPFELIKTIAKCYCKVRFYDIGKKETEKLTGQKIRKKISKLILFENQ